MAIDPIGEKPVIRAPEPGESSPLPQAPTGFGGPTPGLARDTGQSSPMPTSSLASPRAEIGARLAEQQYGPGVLEGIASTMQVGWREDQVEYLGYALQSVDPTLASGTQRMDSIVNSVILNSDPSMIDLTQQKFNRQVALSTQEMFEERSLQRMIGYVEDDEAFSLGAVEQFDAGWGTIFSAGQMFDNADLQKMWFTDDFLGGSQMTVERIRDIAERVGAAELAVRNEAFNEHEMFDMGAWTIQSDEVALEAGRGELAGLSGKGGMWVVQDGNLAIQFSDGEQTWDSLIRLEPGTTIETNADAITAYLLAVRGSVHVLDPTSDETPGRQTWLGAMWERTDDVINTVEKWGMNGTIPALNQQLAAVDDAMTTGRRNPPVDGVNVDQRSLLENIQAGYPEKATTDAMIVVAARSAAADPDAPMSHIVAAGIAAVEETPDEEIAAIHAEQVNELLQVAQAKKDETSYLAEFLQEDVFDPVLGALETWESALQFVGVTVLHLTNVDEIADLGRRVAEEGVSALLDPANIALAPTLNYEQILTDFDDVRQVGLPAFTAAYVEANADATVAEGFGLDPESAAAAWVNIGASLAVDPITWITLGASASWKGLRHSLTTVGGAQKYVYSRPIVSAARQMVVKNNTNLINIFATEGMSSAGITRLARIVATTYSDDAARVAAIGDVQNIIFQDIINGFYLPAGPARALTRKTTLGMGQFFANLGNKGYKSDRFMKFAQDMLVRAPRQRYAWINERDYLSEVTKHLTIRYGDDAVKYADNLDDAVKLYDSVRVGDDAVALLEGQIQVVRAELTALSGGINVEVKFVPTLRKNIAAMDDSLRALDDAIAKRAAVGDDAMRDALNIQREAAIRSRDESQRLLDDLGPVYNDVYSSIREKQKLLERYVKQAELVSSGQMDRGPLEQFFHAMYDDWAESINARALERGREAPIPRVKDAAGNFMSHPWFPDLPLRDWSKVTGKSGTSMYGERVGTLEPFATAAEDMRALGMGAAAGTTPLPASPYELLAFSHTNPAVWDKLHFTRLGQDFRVGMDLMQTVWASSVLLNPRTSIRSSLDEVIRFYENNGANADLFKAGYRSLPGPARWTGGTSSEARAFVRDQMDSFLPSRSSGWELMDPSKRGQWVAAERYVNGFLMNDPQFKAYARAVINGADEKAARALWQEWWNETGSKLARRQTYNSSARGGTAITAGNSFDVIRDSLDNWLLSGFGDDVARSSVTDDMLRAAAAGKNVKPSGSAAAYWRQMPMVPGQVDQATSGLLGRAAEGMFSGFYGAPQARRGGVFYDHYYQWAMETYGARFNRKIIDADWLVSKGKAATKAQADDMIASGTRNQIVRDLVAQTGYALETDLHNAAMRWAATQADDMMYTFGAVSVLGKKMARVYPFGRAQVDYFQWWWKKLTQPTQWGLPGAQGAAAAGAPVNIRLIDRMAHLVSTGTPDERPEVGTPAWAIDNFSFLPYTADKQFLMEGPSFGPAAGWMLNLPLDDVIPGFSEMRRVLQEAHPAHAVFTEPYDSWQDALTGLWDTVVPKHGSSLWALGDTAYHTGLLAAAHLTMGIDPIDPKDPDTEREINAFVNWMIVGNEGPYYRDRVAYGHGQWLAENGRETMPDPLNEDFFTLNDQATLDTLHEDLNDLAQRMAGMPVQSGSDFSYVDVLLPFVDYLDSYVASGSLSDGKRDSIVIGHSVIADGGGTVKDRAIYADDVLDVLFTMLTKEERTQFLAENLESAINLVSWYMVEPSLVPDEYRDHVDGTRIVASGNDRRELIQEGKADGWLVVKDDNQWRYEGQMSVHRATRDRLTDIYEDFAGISIGKDTIALREAPPFPVPAEWWDEIGGYLSDTPYVNVPPEAVAAWTAGADYPMTFTEFRDIFVNGKKGYAYQYTADSLMETKLIRIGSDDRPPSRLERALQNLPGFENVNFDVTVPLAHYGADLVVDINKAVDYGERVYGWADPREWEDGVLVVRDDDGNERFTVTADELRDRLYTATALSSLGADDGMEFTPIDYGASQWSRWFGEVDFQTPKPPPLNDPEIEGTYTAGPDRFNVIDGDTVTVMSDDGPVFFRLLGINAPESTELGGPQASLDLQTVIDNADEVSLVIWKPERYGRTQTFFTREGGDPEQQYGVTRDAGVVQYRDRTFAWVYIDGTPMFDPAAFSATNIRGVGIGVSEVPTYQANLDRERGN